MIWQTFLDGLSILFEKWPVVLAALAVVIFGGGLSFFIFQGTNREEPIPWQSKLLLPILFAISVILRLAFVTETFVPPYFDSVEHFRLVKELVTALESSTFLMTIPKLTPAYYHLGFHLLASLLAFGLHTDPINVVLVLGQVILAAIPIPVFFLIRNETKNDTAAFFGTILAGFGWYMPGFAVNWGKYPALAGLLAFEFVFCVAYFTSKQKRNRVFSVVILILSVLISVLFHSRTLVVILISFTSWIIANHLSNLSKKFQYLVLGIFLTGILILGILIQREPLLNLALDPYLEDGIWVTLVVVILSLFAFMKFPKGSFFNVLFVVFTLPTLFISIGDWLPGFENQSLLDRPFVEMVLYLPLSLLGGLGLAGLFQFIQKIQFIPEKIYPYARVLTTILFLGFAVLMPIKSYNFYPSDCCNFVGYDDTIAFDWLSRNTALDARILIPSAQMNVLPSGPSATPVGTDAGIWIPPLTNRVTTFAAFDIDFSSESTLDQLCQEQVDYIYVGGTEQSFNATQLQAETTWYDAALSLPKTKLYKLIGCSR